MPITKSAVKAMKQADKARIHNREIKNDYRKKVKAVNKEIEVKGDNLSQLVSEAFSLIDKAAKKNVIHKNTAARKKSRLYIKANKSLTDMLILKTTKKPANKTKSSKKIKK